jgi:hypothetical protein
MLRTFGYPLLTATLTVGMCASASNAQVLLGPPPTHAQCVTAVAALDASPKKAIDVTIAQACGAAGGAAISVLLGRSHHESNLTFLRQLTTVSSLIQDGNVYTAALELARDRNATPEARGAGLLILLGQYTLNITFIQSTADMLAGGAPVSCQFGSGETTNHLSSSLSPPLNFATKAHTIAAAISVDDATPERVRSIAVCVAALLPAPPVDDECGSDFKVHNPTMSRLEFAYDVGNGKETGGITVQPGSEATLGTIALGTVKLLYKDKIIQTRANKGTVCQ